MDEVVNADWAKDAIKQIERALEEWNDAHREAEPIRIVWGHSDPGEAGERAAFSTDYQHQDGLLAQFDLDVELRVSMSGDPDLPNSCDLSTFFKEPQSLPLQPRELYNVLQSLDHAVSLSLTPDMESSEIIVVGVHATVAIEGLAGRTLGEALRRLRTSHGLVYEWLSRGRGDDHWKMDTFGSGEG